MKLIERKRYISTLESVRDTPDIKVITGVYGTGKSTLMTSFIRILKEEDCNIIFLDLEDSRNEFLLEYHKLHDYVLSQYDECKANYLLIDEVQLCAGYENAVISLHRKSCLISILQVQTHSYLLVIWQPYLLEERSQLRYIHFLLRSF